MILSGGGSLSSKIVSWGGGGGGMERGREWCWGCSLFFWSGYEVLSRVEQL